MERIVIIGGGLAAGSAASGLRAEGFEGRITLVGAEEHVPYQRPPLSKDYLRAEAPVSDAYVEAASFWAEHEVELLLGRTVERLDLPGAGVHLRGGEKVAFDRLLLATGAVPRSLDVPGETLGGIHTLRVIEDADAIRAEAGPAKRALVVGGGWIGCEIAASLRALGCEVTMVVTGRMPLERQMGAEIAAVYTRMHRDNGVTILPGTHVRGFGGDARVRYADLDSGERIECDLVVVAVGVDPAVALAEQAGLAVDDGILVDGTLATSDPRVFAAGDVARVPSPLLGRPIRVEHWGTALAQGAHAARAMLGSTAAYDEIPYVFSDQYDSGMESWGDPELPGELSIRGDLDARAFTAIWHEEGLVTAVLNLHVHHHHDEADGADAGHDHGSAQDHDHPHEEHEHEHADAPAAPEHGGGHVDGAVVEQLIRSRRPIDSALLRDPGVSLEALLQHARE